MCARASSTTSAARPSTSSAALVALVPKSMPSPISTGGESAAPGELEAPQVRAPPDESPRMTLQKVLLCDDEPDIRRIAEITLTRVGKLAVTLAGSGAQAIELAGRDR